LLFATDNARVVRIQRKFGVNFSALLMNRKSDLNWRRTGLRWKKRNA